MSADFSDEEDDKEGATHNGQACPAQLQSDAVDGLADGTDMSMLNE